MTRVLSGVVIAAAALAAILYLPPLGLRILAAVVAGAAAYEYLALIGVDDSRGRPAYAVAVGGTAWIVSLSTGTVNGVATVPFAVLMLAGIMAVVAKQGTSQQAILGAFACLYVGMPLGLLALLNINRGWRATVLLVATVVVSDSLQFYTGRIFGRHALAPTISPKKTIEGAVGGLVAGTLFMLFAGPSVLPSMSLIKLGVLGFFMVALGILGDLFESRLKREANVKDSGSLIPGHGGVLDRIDALLFVTPAFVLAVGS